MPWYTCGGRRTVFWSQFQPSTLLRQGSLSLLKTFLKIAFYLSVSCVDEWGCVGGVGEGACIGQRTRWGRWFSSGMWVAETKLSQQTTLPPELSPWHSLVVSCLLLCCVPQADWPRASSRSPPSCDGSAWFADVCQHIWLFTWLFFCFVLF